MNERIYFYKQKKVCLVHVVFFQGVVMPISFEVAGVTFHRRSLHSLTVNTFLVEPIRILRDVT